MWMNLNNWQRENAGIICIFYNEQTFHNYIKKKLSEKIKFDKTRSNASLTEDTNTYNR